MAGSTVTPLALPDDDASSRLSVSRCLSAAIAILVSVRRIATNGVRALRSSAALSARSLARRPERARAREPSAQRVDVRPTDRRAAPPLGRCWRAGEVVGGPTDPVRREHDAAARSLLAPSHYVTPLFLALTLSLALTPQRLCRSTRPAISVPPASPRIVRVLLFSQCFIFYFFVDLLFINFFSFLFLVFFFRH